MAVTTTVVIGAVLGTVYNRWVKDKPYGEVARRLGILLASGLIVGESLFGVVLAGLIVALSSDAPLALVPADFPWMNWTALGLFAALIVILYGWIMRRAKAAPAPAPTPTR